MNQVRNEVVEYCLAEGERVGHIFFFNSERAERYSIDVRRNNAEHIYNVYGDDIAKVIMFNNNSMLTIQCINSIDIYKGFFINLCVWIFYHFYYLFFPMLI